MRGGLHFWLALVPEKKIKLRGKPWKKPDPYVDK
jgi:hypothetical protein